MDPGTAAALDRINRDFYHRHAAEFSARRERPWPGWDRVVTELVESIGGDPLQTEPARVAGPPAPHSGRLTSHLRTRPAVLDVACGNARFGALLAERLDGGLDYLGVDRSTPLLELAESRLATAPSGGERTLLRLDFTNESLAHLLSGRRFHLIALFGLLHHLPGLATRRTLLHDLATLLEPGGLLALSFWQFADADRFSRRVVPWDECAGHTGIEIDPVRLEPGDHLLRWGDAGPIETLRYCHHATDTEATELTASLELDLLATWRADGDLNLYHLLRQPDSL